jgi:hypothetical protein
LFARKLRVLLIAAAALLAGVGGAVGYFTFRGVDARAPGSQIEARIQVPGSVFRVATGDGSVLVLTRAPNPAVWRIDPKSNEVVGPPTRLPVDPWDLVVGSGSVWVAPNGADGRITRIDVHSRRITARISARPIYFGSEVVFGGGYLWIGNDDERYKGGSTISKLDPATNRVIGEPLRLGSPQSLASGKSCRSLSGRFFPRTASARSGAGLRPPGKASRTTASFGSIRTRSPSSRPCTQAAPS